MRASSRTTSPRRCCSSSASIVSPARRPGLNSAGSPGCLGELRLVRQRVPSAGTRRRREILLDVEEGCAGDVRLEVELAAARRITQLPPAVDELVPHAWT